MIHLVQKKKRNRVSLLAFHNNCTSELLSTVFTTVNQFEIALPINQHAAASAADVAAPTCCSDTVIASKWRDVLAGNQAFDSKKKELRSFSTAQDNF